MHGLANLCRIRLCNIHVQLSIWYRLRVEEERYFNAIVDRIDECATTSLIVIPKASSITRTVRSYLAGRNKRRRSFSLLFSSPSPSLSLFLSFIIGIKFYLRHNHHSYSHTNIENQIANQQTYILPFHTKKKKKKRIEEGNMRQVTSIIIIAILLTLGDVEGQYIGYAGLQYGSECWCGNSYGKYGNTTGCGTPLIVLFFYTCLFFHYC